MFERHFATAKAFAAALGVGESTVSGWCKRGDAPAYVAAYLAALDAASEARAEAAQARADLAALESAMRRVWAVVAPR